MSKSIERNLLVWLICALAPIGIIGFISHHQTARVVSDESKVIHTHEVREELSSILVLLNTVETSVRGYVITGKDEFLEPSLSANQEIQGHMKTLGQLISDNPEQIERQQALQPLIEERVDRLGKVTLLRRQKGFQPAADMVAAGDGRRLMVAIRREMDVMVQAENKLLVTRNQQIENDKTRALNVTIILTAFALILVGCNVLFARLRG